DSSFSVIKKSFHWLDSVSKTEDLGTEIWTKQKLFISAHPTKATDFDLLYTCNLPRGKSANDINSIIEDLTDEVYTKEEREYEDVRIHELTKNNESIFTYAISKGVFIFSRTSFLVEDAIRQLKSGISFNKTKSFTKTGTKFGSDESILLFINHYGLHDMLTGYIGSERNGFLESINNICRWSRLSFKLEKNAVLFNGLSSSHDTTDLFSSIRNQTTVNSHSAAIAPARTAFLFNFSVSNIEQCLNKLRANGRFFISQENATKLIDSLDQKYKFNLRKLMTAWNTKEIALAITEPGSMNLESNSYAFIRTENTAEANESLQKIQTATGKLKSIEKYRSHTISNFNLNAIVPLFYGNMFIDIQQSYFTTVKDFIVFANSPSILKSLIDDFEDKKVLEKETDYLSHMTRSILTSQINIYFNLQRGTNILRSLSNEDISTKLINDGIFKKTVQSVAVSFSTKNDLTASVGRFDFSGKISKEIHLLWSSQLDTTPATPPYVIVNGDNKYIAIQDAELNLNFYSDAGRLLWKKYLGEKVLSKIYYMDQYNNGECQMIFNTTNKLYLIDTKGDSISNFPIRLPAPASNGCLVKDFDGFKKFEIYVACQNGTIYAYEISGKPLSQWTTKQSVFGIDQPFIPIRHNNTDYIYGYGNRNQYIIDRKGKIVKLKSPESEIKKAIAAFSDSGRKCMLYILDASGSLYSIDPAKATEINALNLSDTLTDISSYGDLLNDKIVLLSRNKLYDYFTTNEIKLITEIQPDEKLQFVNQINFPDRAGMTDKNQNKFYLLSTTSAIEDGYPVWGSSDFSLMKNDDNTAKSYIVISDSNGVLYVYSE
ncbi:MAG: DUF3352 domain-containing protein, partial [Bacteroidia bacterium]|nr:DUF3352 domain-containing protein [Bacteroidia bacterium]